MQTLTLWWQIQGHPFTRAFSDERPYIIGRQADCDVILDDPGISRQHASLTAKGDTFYLCNLSQNNLVRFNNQFRLAYQQTVPLKTGDSFRLGRIDVLVTSAPAHKAKVLKLKCARCTRLVDYRPEEFCPWCGRALANAEALLVEP